MSEQRRSKSWPVISGCVAVVLAGGLLASTWSVPGGAREQVEESWLYVIDARAANSDGQRLRLVDVDPVAVGFSDRPQRTFARFEVSELADTWDDEFADDPPNAAISWFDGDGEHTVVVKLSEPERTPEGLSFAYRELTRTPKRLRSRSSDEQRTLPAELSDVVVFIDAFPTSVNNQITD